METTCSVILSTSSGVVTSTQTVLVTSTAPGQTVTVTAVGGLPSVSVVPGQTVVETSTSLVTSPTVVVNTISSCVGVTPTTSATSSMSIPSSDTPTSTSTETPTETITSTSTADQDSVTSSSRSSGTSTTGRPNTSVVNSFGQSSVASTSNSAALLPGQIDAKSTKTNAGAIAGGIVGGLAGFCLLLGLLILGLRRTRQKRLAAEENDFYRVNGQDGNRDTIFTAGGFPNHSRGPSILPSRPASPPLGSEGYPQQYVNGGVYDTSSGAQAGYGMPQDPYDSASAYGGMNDQSAAAAAMAGSATGAGIGAYYAQQQYAQAVEQQQQQQAQAQAQQELQYPSQAHYDPAVYGYDQSTHAQQPQQAKSAPITPYMTPMSPDPAAIQRPQSTLPNPWSPTEGNFSTQQVQGMQNAQPRPPNALPVNMQSEAWRDSYGSFAQGTPPRMLGVANPDADAESIRSGRRSPTRVV